MREATDELEMEQTDNPMHSGSPEKACSSERPPSSSETTSAARPPVASGRWVVSIRARLSSFRELLDGFDEEAIATLADNRRKIADASLRLCAAAVVSTTACLLGGGAFLVGLAAAALWGTAFDFVYDGARDSPRLAPGTWSSLAHWCLLAVLRGCGELGYAALLLDPDDDGAAGWQPAPLLCYALRQYTIVGLAGVQLMRAHADTPRWLFANFAGVYAADLVARGGLATPCPAVARTAAGVLYAALIVVGTLVVVFCLDTATAGDGRGRRSYLWVSGCAVSTMLVTVLKFAALRLRSKLLNSAMIMSYSATVLTCVPPFLRRGFGDVDSAVYAYPGVLVSLELGQAVLFLGTPILSLDFWLLLALQEVYSVARNTGWLDRLANRASGWVGRPLSHDALRAQRRERLIFTPSDNFAELLSPLLILLVLACEEAYFACGLRGYGVHASVLRAWRGAQSAPLTALSLLLVWGVRVVFFQLESWLVREAESAARRGAIADDDAPEHAAAAARDPSAPRRSSFVLRYNIQTLAAAVARVSHTSRGRTLATVWVLVNVPLLVFSAAAMTRPPDEV